MSDYYVYVYIDPRNYEEFYYGKGCGSRKDAHLTDSGQSRKARRIADIRSVGSEPIIRVIARGLTEDQALLVEATLLWKLGKFTTNEVAGHFSDCFRPHDTFHRDLPGFDFQNQLSTLTSVSAIAEIGMSVADIVSFQPVVAYVGEMPFWAFIPAMFLRLISKDTAMSALVASAPSHSQ